MAARSALGRQWPKEGSRAALRDEMSTAQHAQNLRAESSSRGYKTETKAFYGDKNTPAADGAETRLTVRMADEEHAARRRHDADQAASHVPMTAEETHSITSELKEMGW